jgi:hypothetical protein
LKLSQGRLFFPYVKRCDAERGKAGVVIIQNVIKGIAGLSEADVERIFDKGITSNWLRNQGSIDIADIPVRLTKRNLHWHQNNYDKIDPLFHNKTFSENTPFISTTAGSVERDAIWKKNSINRAKFEALKFATDGWQSDGWLFYCYLFTLGKPSVELQQFAEELRELHIHTGYSSYQPEGEITAKIVIPPAQIRHAELWTMKDIKAAQNSGRLWQPRKSKVCDLFQSPDRFHNIRGYL